MDSMWIDVTLKRGAVELDLLSRSFPGLRFTRIYFAEHVHHDLVSVDVIGSGDDLVRHGFLDAGQLKTASRCKVVTHFRETDGRLIEVRRRASGFRVSRWVSLDLIAPVLAPHVWSPKAQPIR